MELFTSVIGGACGAALVTGLFAFAQFLIKRRDAQNGAQNVEDKALRYIMLYIIQERAKQHIREGKITLEDRRSLHRWHELYHTGLGGNGDADALMRHVDALPVDPDA